MDFQSLSRKELQILCKKNKIPANMTNVAMADALAALTNVEGIEDIGNSQAVVLQSPQTCKGSRRKPIQPEPTTTTQNPDEKSEVLDTPALRTDRKRVTRGASVSNTTQSLDLTEPEMLKTPATRTARKKPTIDAKQKSVATRTRRSARLIQDPQVSEINKVKNETVSDDKSTIQEDKDITGNTPSAEPETQISAQGIQVADEVIVSAEVATQDTTNFKMELLNSNQRHHIQDKSNKLQGDTDAETKICVEEGIQVVNKPEHVPDAQLSPDLDDIHVAQDVPDAEPSPEVLINVEDLASETALGLGHASPEKTTFSEVEEFVANDEVPAADTCNNVAEPVLSPVDDASNGKVILPPVGASSEDSKTNQGSQTDLQLEHPTPGKTDHSDGQQFVTNEDIIAISSGTPNNDTSQVPSPTDDSLSGELNQIKLFADGVSSANVNPVDGAFGANPSDDASGANVAQVLIPQDTYHSVELPGSLVGVGLAHSTLEKANNSKAEEFGANEDIAPTSANVNQVLLPEASGYLGVANEDIGLVSDAPSVNTNLVNCATSADVNQVLCATGNIDAGADTNRVMEQTQCPEGENVESVRSKSENGSSNESPLEELRDLEVHVTESFESQDNEQSVADPLESEISGICKADFPVKGTEVENEKPDNQISSRHSETQGWEAKDINPMVDVNQLVGGAAVDIPFSVTNSILTQVPGSPRVTTSDSKHVLNQTKKASPVSKMALKVFDEEKEEIRSGGASTRNNRSRLNVMSVVEDKAVLVLDENKENTTASASGGMGGKGRQNVVVTEEKKESKEEKGMNNISLRKLKKMFKESLVSNKEQMQVEKTRPALQTLTDNCLVEDGNNYV